MKRHLALGLAGLVAVGSVAAAPVSDQQVAADHSVSLEIGNSETVAGGVPQGFNTTPTTNGTSGGLTCTKDPNTYCETVLIELTNPYEDENARKGRERGNVFFTLTTADMVLSDYDLYVYESDADGAKGSEVTSAGEFPLLIQSSTEQTTVVVSTTQELETVWLLAEVYYFAAVTPYELTIDFS